MGGVSEGVDVALLDPEALDAEIARLADPWIGDEGPLDVGLRRGVVGPLRQRGLAFDDKTTVVWDEDRVQVLRASEPVRGVVALRSPVLLHKNFRPDGPAYLFRIDYLRGGVLLGSRWTTEGGEDA